MANALAVLRGPELGKAPSELVVMASGKVEHSNGEPLVMDVAAAEAIIAQFEEHGVDLPIDYEHASVPGRSMTGKAPAAGWIKALTWDGDRGLVATVEWTDEASEEIASKQYKYWSPVVLYDKETMRPYKLHSVALTNKPAMRGIGELLAASEDLREELDMPEKKTKESTATLQEGEVVEGGDKMADLAIALTKAGVDVEGKGGDALLAAAIEFIKAGSDQEGGDAEEAPDMEAATEVLKALDAKDATEAVLKLKSDFVARKDYDAMSERLEAIETKAKADAIAGKLDEYERANKINPHDAEQVKACKAFAERDFDGFVSFMDAQPALVAAGRVTPKADPESGRDATIAKAAKNYEALSAVEQRLATKRAWIDDELRGKGLAVLDDKEIAGL